MNKVSNGETKKPLHCTFCGKSQHEVRKLIAGPTVFICDECVELCMDIIGEENKSSLVKSRDGIPLLSVPKIRFCNNDDEFRRGQAQLRCGLRAEWRDGSERLCQETDESSTHYNKRHTSSESGVSALRPRRQHGRHTRDESIRSIFRRS